MEDEGNCGTNGSWCAWNNLVMTGKGIGRLGNKRIKGDHPDYSIIKIGLNTEKSPGNLRRLVFTPARNHELTLV